MPSATGIADDFIKVGIGIAIIAIVAGLAILGTTGSTAFESMISTFYSMLPVVAVGLAAGMAFLAMRFAD